MRDTPNLKLHLRDKRGLYLGGIAVGVVHAGVVTLVQPLREGQKPQKTKAMNQKKMEAWMVGTVHVHSLCMSLLYLPYNGGQHCLVWEEKTDDLNETRE